MNFSQTYDHIDEQQYQTVKRILDHLSTSGGMAYSWVRRPIIDQIHDGVYVHMVDQVCFELDKLKGNI
jgi:hypothetical protein